MKPSLLQSVILAAVFVLLAAGFYLSSGVNMSDYFTPHSHCYLFNQQLMQVHGGSDSARRLGS